ncbi:intermembrane lipid transfer protein Vps13 isoform X1 [Diabrotica virgifera virgifera]|uniref:Vacuolar protein sorting-associated protein 13 n=1 Tax=Diabrotica virgifera virgifera TaxID=50390 RepID=A0ABM5IJ13_DIAVI|nr:intermembrane lipid transfer protein Vps13 isoform X1 [Diabrotica virgifera virgifera]
MVFQSVLSYVLNKYLGEFVENLDENQLNVGIWGGDVELKDLVLKPAALAELDLPIQSVYGKIGKLVLKIPWKSLYTSSTVITVEDIYLVVQPNQQVRYDPVKEEQRLYDYKVKEIQRVEETKRAEDEKLAGKAPAKAGWTQEFAEKLVATIIKNIQLSIKHIHIRYEDKVTNPKFPFSFGVTLDQLIVESTDANWKKTIADDIIKIYKILHLENLAIYLNCKSSLYGDLPVTQMLSKLELGIASKEHNPDGFKYILGPINSSARLIMNQKPEIDQPPYTIPKFHFNLQMETLYIGMNKSQYRDIIALVDSMGRMTKGIPYRKYRPNLTEYKGHYRDWWKFAITAVLEQDVKRKRREWNWDNILDYRKKCRTYKELYSLSNQKKALKPEDAEKLKSCEKGLDLTNLIIIRQQVQAQAMKEAKEKGKQSWWDWAWGSKSNSSKDGSKGDIIDQFKKEMTPEEKQNMYKAIGYQENAAPAEYPEEFVDITATFLLKALQLELSDVDLTEKSVTVLKVDLNTVRCKLETRAAASAMKVQVKVDDFRGEGYREGDFIPYLITSEKAQQEGLLEVLFETNPLDKRCDQRVHVTALPLKIIYDANTVNKLADIFKIPPDSNLEQIADVAQSRLTDFKEMSSLGLQYAVEKRPLVDLNVDLQAPILLMPHTGKYTGNENILLVNLGRVKVFSYGRRCTATEVKRLNEEGKTQAEIFAFMKEHSYDNFKLELTNVQILAAERGENWSEALTTGKSKMHILNPVSLSITFSTCLITDDPRLPLNKVAGVIPSIDLVISDARLLLVIGLFTSIKFPGDEIPEAQPLRKAASSTLLLKYKEMQATGKNTKQLIANLADAEASVQFTTLSAEFEMSKLSVVINKQGTTAESAHQLAKFRVDTIKCDLKQQTYITDISLILGGIALEMERDSKIINIIETPRGDCKDDCSLFKVEFMQVDTKCPEFYSTYKSCESSLLLNFEVLNIILHQEGLLSLMKFGNEIQERIAEATEVKTSQDRIATIHSPGLAPGLATGLSTLASIAEEFTEELPKEIKKRSKRKKVTVQTIKFKISAALKEVSLKIATDATDVSRMAISGANATVIVKDTYTQVNATLSDMTVMDLNKRSVHELIMSRLEGDTLSAQVVMNNNEDVETDLPDMDITVQLGRSRIVFMNWYVSNMLNFLNQFQAAQDAIVEASQKAAEAARENMKEAYKKATKISLNVIVKAPIIMVPINSHSYDSLLLDMGIITLENKFLTLDIQNEEGHPAVIDDLKIGFKDLKMSRVLLDEHYGLVNEYYMLEPFNLNLSVKRNLSASWYQSVPDLDISGNIPSIHIMMGNIDYQRIMEILSGNLAEGKVEAVVKDPVEESKELAGAASLTASASVVSTKADVAKEIWMGATKQKPHIFLKFSFAMEKFTISLHHNLTDERSKVPGADKQQFAKFWLEGLSVKGRIMTDNSIVTSVLLMNCLMDDARPGREGKLNRIIDRSSPKDATYEFVDPKSASTKSMIDVTFQMKDNEMFADIRVFSFTIILSIEYLMKLAEFFKIPEEQEQEIKMISAGKSNVPTPKVKPADTPAAEQHMTINLKLEKPDIILVEHMDNVDTRAMILNAEILLKYRAAGKHQVVNGIIKELELYRCVYNPEHRPFTRCNVLHPLDISLAGSTPPEKGLHLELLVTSVYLSVSPATIELLNKTLATMTGGDEKDKENDEKVFEYDDLWKDSELKPEKLWYLNTEYGTDALALEDTCPADHGKVVLQELCIISIPSVTVTVEAGVGNKTLPMLMLETGFSGSVKNWSSQMILEAALTMQMGYYNSKLASWEPLIEPEVFNNKHIPWELKVEVTMNPEQPAIDNTSVLSPAESESEKCEIELPPPLMQIDLESEKNLELTVTKTLLENLQYLGKAFASALDKENIKTQVIESPYKVINALGEDITLLLEESSFTGPPSGVGDVNTLQDVPLELKKNLKENEKLHLGQELLSNSKRKSYTLKLEIPFLDSTLTLPVNRADKRYFPLNYRSSIHDNWALISDIRVEEAVTIITLRSTVQVHNYFNVPIDVYYMTSKGNQLLLVNTIKPNDKLNVPLKAVYTPTTELFFGVPNYSVTATPFTWKELETNLKVTKILQCYPKTGDNETMPFVIKAVGEMEQVYYEHTTRHTMASTCYNINLRPAVIFKNSLPYNVVCCVDESPDEFTVEPGDTLQLPTVDPGKNCLVFRIPEYLEKEWSCRKALDGEPEEFSVWSFESFDSATKMILDLGMYIVRKNDSLELMLYCPFWMINKTGLMLGYRKSKKCEKADSSSSPKSSDEALNVLYHPRDFQGPILFSFNAKNFFGKKKASVRVENGEWSNKFSVDVAGSSGFVNCKWNEQTYQIGVQNSLTHNGLTKQITFIPYYVIINEAPYAIECQEHNRPADHWVTVEPKSCTALWPKSDAQDKLMKIRVKGTQDSSAPFLYTESHNTLLRLNNKYGGVNVDIQLTEGTVYINLAPYEDGSAPALLVNHSNYTISYWEKDSVQKRELPPSTCCYYTWENPSGPRSIVWDRGNKKEIINDLRKDMYGEFAPEDGAHICWTSFLDGMQRVLLFTEDRALAEGAQASNILEVIQQEITVSIHGIGLSLVNNQARQEIMYLGIASSGVIWGSCKLSSTRFKFFDAKLSTALENAYQACLRESEINPNTDWHVQIDPKTEVDFKANMMYKPTKKIIRRTFLTGLWLNMKTSPSQKQIHAKINRLQIDNQLYDCIFPVVLAPVPPPKSVTANDGIKPFIEVSIVQLLMKNSQILQFKYFKVLVQEFHIKLDMGFVSSILEMLQEDEASAETEKQLFLTDKHHVEETLYALASTQSSQEQKSFYDLLHFSPFKIHISFSLAAGSSSSSQNISTPPLVHALLQGIGVTLTDLNDVVFKLAFFERNFTFLTQKQLISEATSHYVGQAIKQFYVLVLGLDVLGNPYGLVLGITKGVEDLFYEPFQGAIQGPGEFVEGLALGVRSLFGHTVGGAAGAMSKITGAMGKGIAALTFDDDFQRKRREKQNRKPQNVQEGLARSGKGLVMGVYSGVTGVFTKPVEGAKEEGVEGFFKGLGKGAVGLVTRPVAGVVDFASDSLDVVKRAAEGGEDTLRLRAPRFLHSDKLVRPYNLHEATGNRYLNHISKGKYAKTDVYVAHYIVVEKKEVLLLTDRRVAYLMHNDIFGGWQIEWSYTWEEITAPGKVTPKGVQITTSEKKKKLFGSSSNTKLVLIVSPQIREEICEKMESLRTA